jgi:hypothetical protein
VNLVGFIMNALFSDLGTPVACENFSTYNRNGRNMLLLRFCTCCHTVWLFFKFLIHFCFQFLKDSSELISLAVLRQEFTNFSKNLERTLKFSAPEGWRQASSVLGTRSIRCRGTKFSRPVVRGVCTPVRAVSVLTDVRRCVVDDTAAEFSEGPRFKSYLATNVLTSMLVFRQVLPLFLTAF